MVDLEYLWKSGSIRLSERVCASCAHLPKRHDGHRDPETGENLGCDARSWGRGSGRCGCLAFVQQTAEDRRVAERNYLLRHPQRDP